MVISDMHHATAYMQHTSQTLSCSGHCAQKTVHEILYGIIIIIIMYNI